MSENVTITLEGTRDIIAALNEFKEYLPKTALRIALRKAAQFTQAYIAFAAPVLTVPTKYRQSGQLIKNLRVAVSSRGKWIRAKVVVNTKGDKNDPMNSFYWKFLEEGFHTKSGEYKKFPFIRPQWDQKNRESAQFVFDAIEESLARAERKAKRNGII